jgi:hypothetical protein
VIDEKTSPDPGAWMDVDSRLGMRELRDNARDDRRT